MISRFFILRPVFSNVIALIILLIGTVSIFNLPISQYPDVVPPTVQVTTSYPGASATLIAKTVALPIEQQVNGVPGMIYMQSYSSDDGGAYTLTVTFKIGTDVNQAQVLVQNRVAAALASLPSSVQTQGVVVQKRSTAILLFTTLTSPDGSRDPLFLSNYATINLVNELERLPGVGNVTVFGAAQYAMRIWIDPNVLQARNLEPSDVLNAIQQTSVEVPAGQLGAPPHTNGSAFQYTLNVNGRFDDPAEFEKLIVKTAPALGGQLTRIKDIGRVELGAQTYSETFKLSGAPAIGIAISQDPSANALDVAEAVQAKMRDLSKSFPPGIAYNIPFNTTKFVYASIKEVVVTLFETGLLVLAVILLFLQDWRAMMVPATTVPVTLVGAFAAMVALGFTINISTLLAIVLAIGIVVDDAIVVVEGATHFLEAGSPPREAAERAMNQLFGPIIGITLVLMSVFTPAAFLPGLTGKMYAQFALVIAATALISAINAVTLKPTQCATFLRVPTPPEKRNIIYRGFNAVYDRLEKLYGRFVRSIVAHSRIAVTLALLIVCGSVFGLALLPTGFLPLEDQGYFIVSAQLPSGASLERTTAVLDHVTKILKTVPGVQYEVSIAGVSAIDNNSTSANAGTVYVVLTDWSKRGKGEGLKGMYKKLSKALDAVDDARILVVPPPAIQGVGNSGGFTMQTELRNGSLDWALLQKITEDTLHKARNDANVTRLNATFRADVPQFDVDVNRAKAEILQVPVQNVFDNLTASIGSSYAGQFDRFGHVFQVFVQSEGRDRINLSEISRLRVRNSQGDLVPFGSIVSIKEATGPSLVSLYNLYPSATILGSPAPGVSSGEALDTMEHIAGKVLPPGTGFDWTAMSYQQKQVGAQIYLVFGLALVLVYLVLAAQYESWWIPLSVLIAVPMALVGPVVTLHALGVDNNLYTQIGLILLVALSAKNAILIVEVAREKRLAGAELIDSAVEAAVARFRPILMTSIAFSFGVLPLVFATGAGANARLSIGITTFTGMISSTCFAVVLVPVFFVVIRGFEERRHDRKAKTLDRAPKHGDDGIGQGARI